jgi:hypothetical protein
MSALPSTPAARKAIPVFSGFVRYFPRAIAAVAELSRIGNDQHNPGEPLHWAREKSGDELDACARHLLDAGTIDDDGVRHSTKLAWRAMANLEKELERAVVRPVEVDQAAVDAIKSLNEKTLGEQVEAIQAASRLQRTEREYRAYFRALEGFDDAD